MRILFFSTDFPPHLGGVATLSLEQAVGLARLGNQVRVETVDFGNLPEVCHRTPNLVVNAHRIKHIPIARLLPLFSVARRSASEFRADLFYASTHRGFGLPMATVARRSGRPYVLYAHGTEILTEQHNPLRRAILSNLMTRAAIIICNSANTARIARELLKLPAEQVTFIHPAVDQNRLSDRKGIQQAEAIRKEWLHKKALPPDTIVLLSLCRLSKQKGVDRVLESLRCLKTAKPEIRFLYVIGGSGPDENEFKQLTEKLGLSNNVLFLGTVQYEETTPFYRAADIYVQPSQWLESFGISFVEAEFCGLPCIGTKLGGIPESVRDGETGILVEPGDERGLQEAILTLMTNEELRRSMSEAARKFAAQFSWENHCRQLHEIFEQCVAEGGKLR